MIETYIPKLETLVYSLNGKKIEVEESIISPNYLYRFPNNLWLSIEEDIKDHFFSIRFGRLYVFKDAKPRIIVLENIKFYFDYFEELKLTDDFYSYGYKSYNMENNFEYLYKNLHILLNIYNELIKNEKIQQEIEKEYKKLSQYLITDISNTISLEDDVHKYFIKDDKSPKKVIKKLRRIYYLSSNTKDEMKSALVEGLIEIGVYIVFILLGLGIMFLFSLFMDISSIPFEVFCIIGIMVVILIVIIVAVIYNLRRKD